MPTTHSAAAPEMSAATRSVLGKVRRMIPPMLDKFHKGPFSFPRAGEEMKAD